jgi:hypothetical protein
MAECLTSQTRNKFGVGEVEAVGMSESDRSMKEKSQEEKGRCWLESGKETHLGRGGAGGSGRGRSYRPLPHQQPHRHTT